MDSCCDSIRCQYSTSSCQNIPDFTLPACGHHYCKMCFLKLQIVDDFHSGKPYHSVVCDVLQCYKRSPSKATRPYIQEQHKFHSNSKGVSSQESDDKAQEHNESRSQTNRSFGGKHLSEEPHNKSGGIESETSTTNHEKWCKSKMSVDQGTDVPDWNLSQRAAKRHTANLCIKGLPSNGMSCYFNTVLQILAQTPGLIEILKKCQKKHGPVNKALFKILMDIKSQERNSENDNIVHEEDIDDLRRIICVRDQSFAKGIQNDCHSFLVCLLNSVKEDLPDGALSILEGQMRNVFSYSTCPHKEGSDLQMFNTLLLPLENHKFSIEDGLIILKREEEYRDSSIPCRICQDMGQQFKDTVTKSRMVIEKPPKILILHIGRFREQQSNTGYKWLEKIQDNVHYNDVVDMTELCHDSGKSGEDPYVYKLFGVISHQGTLYDGHYFAHVKENRKGEDRSHDNGQWYRCVNEDIQLCRENEHLQSRDAYLMFYEHFDFM